MLLYTLCLSEIIVERGFSHRYAQFVKLKQHIFYHHRTITRSSLTSWSSTIAHTLELNKKVAFCVNLQNKKAFQYSVRHRDLTTFWNFWNPLQGQLVSLHKILYLDIITNCFFILLAVMPVCPVIPGILSLSCGNEGQYHKVHHRGLFSKSQDQSNQLRIY